MKIIAILFVFILFSCTNIGNINIAEFEGNIITKRIKYEYKINQCFNNFNDRNIKELYNLLSEDKSFVSLYITKPIDVYYSSNSYKFWNFVSYQNFKELIEIDNVKINCSLGILSIVNSINNGVSLTTNPSVSRSVDSILCIEYNMNEFSPTLFIFFDNKKNRKEKKILLDDKLNAKSSSFTNGKHILIDTLSSNP